jgi:signal transduction histidine kinase
MLEIIVADAGSGFDPAAQPTRPSDEGGFGLTHLRERIAAIGGVMTIEAAPGSGTKITLRSPIVAPAAVADDSPDA